MIQMNHHSLEFSHESCTTSKEQLKVRISMTETLGNALETITEDRNIFLLAGKLIRMQTRSEK